MSDTDTQVPDADQADDTVTQADAAPAADATPDATVPDTPAKDRSPASDLEGDLRVILNQFVQGQITLGDGVHATPHTLAGLIAKHRGDGKAVSSGAVSAALARWAEVGFITLRQKPTAFDDFTDEGRTHGLKALKERHRQAKKDARAAAKAADAPAPAAAAPATDEGNPPF